MKLKQVIENIIDMPEPESTEPARKPNMAILDKQVQKAIDKAFQSSEEVKNNLEYAKVKIEGPNVLLTTKNKAGKENTGTIPMAYLSKFLYKPKILADILLKKGM